MTAVESRLNRFIERVQEVHEHKYDYSKVKWKNNKTKIEIVCPIHGSFWQSPTNHYRCGCPKCGDSKKHKSIDILRREFIAKADKIHGDKYDYSMIKYVNNKTKIEIICPTHGPFWAIPSDILRGHGCPQCGIDKIKDKLTLSTDEFIKRASFIHNNKYDYSAVSYVDNLTKIDIICPKHGKFSQTPKAHMNGIGCRECAIDKMRMTKEEFIKRASEIHNNKYDYSEVDYVGYNDKVKIMCPKHGLFLQRPHNHVGGQGCPKCGLINSIVKQRQTNDGFITKAKNIHGDKYDYSNVIYNGNKKKVEIVCPVHGSFHQTPNAHLRYGCKKCANEDPKNHCHVKPKTKEYFVNRSRQVHGDKYDYSKSDYINCMTDVEIICPKHGIFKQKPTCHYIQKYKCPRCSNTISEGQQNISDFVKLFLSTKLNDRKQIHPLEIDIWVPSKSLGIEYHGLYYHSYNSKETTEEKNAHVLKADLADEKSINLIQIFEDEWLNKKELIKSMIKSRLGMNDKVMARKCSIKEVPGDQYRQFCETNHVQGYKAASVKYGLYDKDELVSVMSFNKKKDHYEIERLCSKQGITVVGGATKLFKHFLKKHNPNKVISYCDRRHGTGNVYKQMGMKLVKKTSPNYFYCASLKRHSRIKFQKHKLKDKLEDFDSNLTEAENMFNNGYRRIWDAGHFKFEWSCGGSSQ